MKKRREWATLPSRIRWALDEYGMTQMDLCRKVGMSQGTLSNLLGGKTRTSRYVVEMADAIGVSATWLDSGKGQPDRAFRTAGARHIAQVFDSLTDREREEVVGYVRYVVSRRADPKDRDPLANLLDRINT